MEKKSEIKKIDQIISQFGTEKGIEIICSNGYELVC